MSTLKRKLEIIFTEPRLLAKIFMNYTSCIWSDKMYLRIMFWLSTGKRLNLKNPRTFNEKLQWLKLYDRRPEYTIMVDKVKAKEYVASIIGEEHIIPTLGVWERPEDIDFDALPNQFVLKCNHNSGTGMYIAKDKSQITPKQWRQVLKGLRKGLREDYFFHGREWPYKNVPRRILAEKFMVDESGTELKDYKVFNFGGDPHIIEVDFDRFVEYKRNFYSIGWKFIEKEVQYKSDSSRVIAKPKQLDQMLKFARMLSKGMPHLRVDFYLINNSIYFGEMTFFHEAGMGIFRPEEWDEELGQLIVLPNRSI